MHKYKIFIGIATSIALIASTNTLFAEDSVSAEEIQNPKREKPMPPVMLRRQNDGSTTTGQGAGGLPPRPPKPVLQEGAPKTSVATGTKLATGTRPISPEMRREVEHRDEIRDKMMLEGRMGSRTPSVSGKLDERIQQARDQRNASKGEMMKIFAEKTGERLRTAIERMEKLILRTDSRVAKLRGEGKDTSIAEGHLTNAKTSITKAKLLIDEARNIASTWVPPTDVELSTSTQAGGRPQPGLGTPSPMREPFKKAGDELKSAHKDLIAAVEALKLLGGKASIHATSTGRIDRSQSQSTTTNENE